MTKKTGGECPICGEETIKDFRPFCSKRCADVDLGRWMRESYAIPTVEEDEPDDEDYRADTPMTGALRGPH